MSKQRPSRASAAAPVPHQPMPPRPWLRRVFHNTYTRRGRRIALGGWSVKLQYGGQRHTFSLAARTRYAAAAEARAIQEKINATGWEAVVQQYSGRRGRTSSKTDPRWWQERLLLRNYPAPLAGERQREFSTHIEHAGVGSYFPLGTSDPEGAAVRALEIYRKVREEGWCAAGKLFSREVTLAFHWAYDPLLWTYTTLHTSEEGSRWRPTSDLDSAKDPSAVLVVETDRGIRNALSRCINRCAGYYCVACPTPDAARRQSAARRVALCLFNRDLAGKMGLPKSGQIGTLAGGLPAVSYGVHTDSEELFALTPGGASSYVLKRTTPDHLLEPIMAVLTQGRPTAEALARSARSYFQRLLQGGSGEQASRRPAQLTLREQDVLNLMGKGYLDKEIAPALGISAWTVHEHVKRIFEKLQVHSRTEAVLAYLQK